MTGSIDVRGRLSEETFVREYMRARRPVVIEGALNDWAALRRWTIPFLRKQYRNARVLVQGSTFRPIRVQLLSEVLDQMGRYDTEDAFGRDDVPYVRYTHLPDTETDDLGARIIEELSGDWALPSFLPRDLYFIPRVERDADPSTTRFPSFGLYVSPRGACTSLHVDADMTSAVNCQLQGEKRWFVFEPALAESVSHLRLPPTNLKLRPLPDFGGVKPTYVFTVKPGQVLYLPGDWYHEVYTLKSSISLTFNFVHLSEAPGWVEAVFGRLSQALEGEQTGRNPSVDWGRLGAMLNSISFILGTSQRHENRRHLCRWGMGARELSRVIAAVEPFVRNRSGLRVPPGE